MRSKCHIDVHEKELTVRSTASNEIRHDPKLGFLAIDGRPPVSIPTTDWLSDRKDWFVTVPGMATRQRAGSPGCKPLNSHSARLQLCMMVTNTKVRPQFLFDSP